MFKLMEISVIGTGYVGLVAGTCFAESGQTVTCVDINSERVKKLQDGIIPIYEPGLEELVRRNLKQDRLFFTTNTSEAIGKSEVIFIAVGTPSQPDGSSDLSAVYAVCDNISQVAQNPKIVVLKSTVPVGTARELKAYFKKRPPITIVSNPEFLKEGTAVQDFLRPERVVIGSDNIKALEILREIYEPFVRSGNPILEMDNTSAELSKYACNSFLAMKISFINEIANLSTTLGADVNHVRRVMMSDSRIGNKFLYAGTGYGGSCFPKDVRSLVHTAKTLKQPLSITTAVEIVNESQKIILFEKLVRRLSNLDGKRIAIWGVSFKPNTDDIREAPSIAVIEKLLEKRAIVSIYDPLALENAREQFGNRIQYAKNQYDCLKDAEALLLFTEWNEFRKPNFSKMKSLMKNPLLIDGRNLFSPREIKETGFLYEGIGLQ